MDRQQDASAAIQAYHRLRGHAGRPRRGIGPTPHPYRRRAPRLNLTSTHIGRAHDSAHTILSRVAAALSEHAPEACSALAMSARSWPALHVLQAWRLVPAMGGLTRGPTAGHADGMRTHVGEREVARTIAALGLTLTV